MSVKTDVVNLKVNVGNNAAQNQLNELGKKAAQVRMEMDNLGKRTKAFGDKKKELADITAQMDKLKQSIGITALTQKELVAEQKKLLALRNSVPPFTAEWKKYDEQLKGVKNRLYDVNNGVRGFASMWSKVKDEVKQFGLMAAGYLGFQFITQQFSSLIQGAGKLSDSLADIQKVTGLTSQEVKQLNNELKTFDTRTSSEALRQLAYEAGKLGIEGKENILGFVKAADMIQVALGEDLGDGATLAIGKIATVFKTIEQFGVEGGLLKIGSAINSVGQASAASEGYIVEFAKRMGGIAVPAKISAAEIIGLAGTMDSLGATSEVSTTALGNTIGKLVTNFKGFAEVAGITEGELRKIFDEKGGLGALTAVLKGIKENGGNFESLVGMLGDIGIEGSRAKAVLGLLADNLPELARQVGISNQAFADGTSVLNEFNIKNQTLGATLDKLAKEFNKLVSSSTIQNFLKGLIEGTYNFIKGLQALPNWINQNSTALKLLAAGIVLVNLQRIKAIALQALESKAMKALLLDINLTTIAQKASAAATTLWGAVTALVTGNIRKMQAELKLLRVIIGPNPLGVLLIGLGLAIAAYQAFEASTRKVITAQKLLNDINVEANKQIAEEQGRVMQLTAILKDNTVNIDTRRAALNELIKINPEYLKGLTLENIATEAGTKILERYNKQLFAKAQLEALKGRVTDVATRDLDAAERIRKLEEEKAKAGNKVVGMAGRTTDQDFDARIANIASERAGLKKELEEINKLQADIMGVQQKAEESVIAENNRPLLNRVFAINKELKKLKEGTAKYKKLVEERNRLKQTMADSYSPKTTGLKTDNEDNLPPYAPPNPDSDKKKFDEVRQKFLDFYQTLRNDLERSKLSPKDVEIFNAQQVAQDQLTQLNDYFNKGIVEASEFTQARNAIEGKLEQALADIEAKYAQNPESLQSIGKTIAENMLPSAEDMNRMAGKAMQDLGKALALTDRSKLGFLDAALTNARGGRDQREAQIAVWEEERRQSLLNTELTEGERAAIIAKYEQQITELRNRGLIDSLQQWIGIAQQISGIVEMLTTRQANREQAAYNREKRLHDQRKKLYKDQLDNRLISQAVYDKKVAELDAQEDNRKKEIERKQFERQKKMNIVNAIMNGAMAITSILAQYPKFDFGIAAAIAIGASIATTAAQVAVISKQQPPEMARGGKLRRGPKHSHRSRGLQVVNPLTGQVEALVERGEAIVSSATMDDNTVYSATGTPSQIASTLNGINGGNTWASPAVVRPISAAGAARRALPAWTAEMPSVVKPIRTLAQGGVLGNAAQNNNPAMGELANKMDVLVNSVLTLSEDVRTWRRDLHAVVSIKEYREQEALYDAARISDAL